MFKHYATFSFCAEFTSQATFDEVKYIEEICKHALQLQKVQKSRTVELEFTYEQRYSELKSSHEEECFQLRQQLEEQSKQANEALQQKAQLVEELFHLHQERGGIGRAHV